MLSASCMQRFLIYLSHRLCHLNSKVKQRVTYLSSYLNIICIALCKCNWYMPWLALFTKPVALSFSKTGWHKFHGPIHDEEELVWCQVVNYITFRSILMSRSKDVGLPFVQLGNGWFNIMPQFFFLIVTAALKKRQIVTDVTILSILSFEYQHNLCAFAETWGPSVNHSFVIIVVIIMIGWSSSRPLASHKCDQGLDLRLLELRLLLFAFSLLSTHHITIFQGGIANIGETGAFPFPILTWSLWKIHKNTQPPKLNVEWDEWQHWL